MSNKFDFPVFRVGGIGPEGPLIGTNTDGRPRSRMRARSGSDEWDDQGRHRNTGDPKMVAGKPGAGSGTARSRIWHRQMLDC